MTISRNETQCSIWSILIEKNVVASGIFWPQRNKANHNKAKFGLTAIFEMSTLWLYVWAVSNALNVHWKLLKCIKKGKTIFWKHNMLTWLLKKVGMLTSMLIRRTGMMCQERLEPPQVLPWLRACKKIYFNQIFVIFFFKQEVEKEGDGLVEEVNYLIR